MTKKTVDQTIKAITQKIIKEYQPEKIILFGSYAWGKPRQNSDVDLFIIKDSNSSNRELARQIDKTLFWRDVSIDLIVDKPDHVEKRLQLGDPFFIKIFSQGKILYEFKREKNIG